MGQSTVEPSFSIKDLNVSQLKDIQIIDVSADLYFGRRFQVMKTDESNNFVVSDPLKFSEIIKNVKKLSKNENDVETLKEIDRFLGTLKTVEDESNFAFNQRNCFYRMLTKIQRIFKSKSNLERIKDLKTTVEDKIKTFEPNAFAFDEKKEAIKHLPIQEQQAAYISLIEECLEKGQPDYALEISRYILSGKVENDMRTKIAHAYTEMKAFEKADLIIKSTPMKGSL